MPELPEVETTLLGLQPHLLHQTIQSITVRQYQLRWPIPKNIHAKTSGHVIQTLSRRGKYLLIGLDNGTLLIHLGMSGRFSLVSPQTPPGKHDHIDIALSNQLLLRYNDPRRFGACLWVEDQDILQHPLLIKLGLEPFDPEFTGSYLYQQARKRTMPIKSFIMNHHIVVGVGNIYATEALFMANLHPNTPAKHISADVMDKLATIIKTLLQQAIQRGGTTLKDFLGTDGRPGYFSLELQAYGRNGLPCVNCETLLIKCSIGQRTSTFCPSCQQTPPENPNKCQ